MNWGLALVLFFSRARSPLAMLLKAPPLSLKPFILTIPLSNLSVLDLLSLVQCFGRVLHLQPGKDLLSQ